MIYYAPTIFQQAGFHSALSSILATAGVGLVNVVMTIVSIAGPGGAPASAVDQPGWNVRVAARS